MSKDFIQYKRDTDNISKAKTYVKPEGLQGLSLPRIPVPSENNEAPFTLPSKDKALDVHTRTRQTFNRIKTRLTPADNDTLPNVRHREQSPSVKVQTHEQSKRGTNGTFESTSRNQEKEFYSAPLTDLYEQCSKLVIAINSGAPIDKVKEYLYEYGKALESIGICRTCKHPFKTHYARQGETRQRKRKTLNARVSVLNERSKHVERYLNVGEYNVDILHVENCDLENCTCKAKGKVSLTFRAEHYAQGKAKVDFTFADVPCHFEVIAKKGEKAYMFFVGIRTKGGLMNKNIRRERIARKVELRNKFGQTCKQTYFRTRFFDCETSETILNVPKTYRIIGKCSCD